MTELGHSQVGNRDEVSNGPEAARSPIGFGLLQQPVDRLHESVAAVIVAAR